MSKPRFLRIVNGMVSECYITKVEKGLVYYGHYTPGHANKEATAVMAAKYFNKLVHEETSGKSYFTGCTHGPYTNTLSHIVGKVVYTD